MVLRGILQNNRRPFSGNRRNPAYCQAVCSETLDWPSSLSVGSGALQTFRLFSARRARSLSSSTLRAVSNVFLKNLNRSFDRETLTGPFGLRRP